MHPIAAPFAKYHALQCDLSVRDVDFAIDDPVRLGSGCHFINDWHPGSGAPVGFSDVLSPSDRCLELLSPEDHRRLLVLSLSLSLAAQRRGKLHRAFIIT